MVLINARDPLALPGSGDKDQEVLRTFGGG